MSEQVYREENTFAAHTRASTRPFTYRQTSRGKPERKRERGETKGERENIAWSAITVVRERRERVLTAHAPFCRGLLARLGIL